jgi:heme-degrading monooxygenase HmoA
LYLHHELREVTPHRQTEAVERIHTLHSLMAASPAFIRALSCRYEGRIDQYAWLRLWNSSAEQTAFRQTQPAKEFAQTRPEGLYQPLPGGIAAGLNWESVLEHVKEPGGDLLVRSVFKIGGMSEAEFLDSRGSFDKAALETKGIGSLLTFHSTDPDSAGMFLTLTRCRDREAYNRFLESRAEVALAESATGRYETLTTECYRIVDEVPGGRK